MNFKGEKTMLLKLEISFCSMRTSCQSCNDKFKISRKIRAQFGQISMKKKKTPEEKYFYNKYFFENVLPQDKYLDILKTRHVYFTSKISWVNTNYLYIL